MHVNRVYQKDTEIAPEIQGQVTQLGLTRAWTKIWKPLGTNAATLSLASCLLLSVLLHSLFMKWFLGCSMSMTWPVPSYPLCVILYNLNQNLKLMHIKNKNASNRLGENTYNIYIWQNLEFFELIK